MERELEPYQRVERSIQKKFRKSIWVPFIAAVKRYELIQENDKIAVCISGGKDSMLMAKLLQELQRHSEVPFELVYLVLPLIVLAWIFAKHFNIVGMGRDFSKNLGVNYTLVLFSGLTIAAMITAAIVSVVGSISYIGLIVPNLIAIFKGDDLRSTLADTALFGALFVLCCDVIGRLVIAPYELPIELIIGTIGSLLFIALIFYRLRFGRMSLDKKQLLRLFGLDRRTPACGGAK